MNRKKLEALVWRHKHLDYRSVTNGERSILVNAGGQGTILAPLASLTDAVLLDQLPRKVRNALLAPKEPSDA